MNNCLIFITSSYPYLTQESFIESEIPYLQKKFSKIITLAIDADKNAKIMRAVPENADCYNIAAKRKLISRTQAKLSGAVNYIRGSEFSDIDPEADTPKRKIFMEYFCARAKKEFNLCMKILGKYDFTQYDSITVYSYWFFVAAMIGTMIKNELSENCKNIKLISRAHRYDIYEDVNSLNYLPLRAYLLNKVDAVYACSRDGEMHIKKRYPVFAQKIKHAYLGTIDSGLNVGSEDGFHIVSCSRAASVKRLDRIAQSLALLNEAGIKNLKWTHIGDGPELQKVKKLAEEKLGFMSVDFKGNLCNADVLNFYRKNPVDFFLNVSTSEGLPVSIMEANSFGIPAIATKVGGVDEIIKNQFNGILIPSDFSNEDLAFEIKRMAFSDGETMQRFRENARGYWEENFNAHKNYTEFTELI